jgi:hypothetical protein
MCSASPAATSGANSPEELNDGAAAATQASDNAMRPLILDEQTVMKTKERRLDGD